MTFISSLFKYVFTILLVIVAGYSLYTAYQKYENPCSLPITYSVDSFDKRFSVSKESFLKTANTAEKTWESKSGIDLFEYKELGGVLALNLVYDERQNATNKLGTLDSVIDSSKGSYDTLKNQYDEQVAKYNEASRTYESNKKIYDSRREVYQNDVSYWNGKGGASQGKYKELAAEKTALTQLQRALEVERKNLNSLADLTNSLAEQLNVVAKNLNMNISQYNAVGKTVDKEFDQGVYERDSLGTRINIYQFDNTPALLHVLTHELGHALSLEHSDDKASIMYYLHEDIPQVITDSDIQSLKKVCKIN